MFGWIKRMSKQWFANQTEHQIRIEEFMRKGAQELPDKPTVPANDVIMLRARLVMEEAFELLDAMGVDVYTRVTTLPEPTDKEPTDTQPFADIHTVFKRLVFTLRFDESMYLDEVAKEAADLSVVTIGTLSAFGIKDKQVLEAVDQNNLEKFGPGGHRDPVTGKWIKPLGHKKPDLYWVNKK